MARKPAPKSKNLAKSRKKTYTWRKAASTKRSSKQITAVVQKYLSVFLLFSVSFIFLFGYLSFKKLTSPFVSAYSTSSYDIRGQDIFVMGYYEIDSLESATPLINKVVITVFDTTSKSVLSFDVSPAIEVDVSGRYANEPLSKVLGLSMSVNNNDVEEGVHMLNSTLSSYLGYDIDKYIVADSELAPYFNEVFFDRNALTMLDLTSMKDLDSSLRTNMNFHELYYAYNFIGSLSRDQIDHKTLDSSSDQLLTDSYLRGMTFDSKVAYEKKSIAILNGTSMPGVATFGARVVENYGGRIVGIDNASKKYEKSVLIVDDTTSHTAIVLKNFFDNVEVLDKASIDPVHDSEFIRADIVLIIGIDIAERL